MKPITERNGKEEGENVTGWEEREFRERDQCAGVTELEGGMSVR